MGASKLANFEIEQPQRSESAKDGLIGVLNNMSASEQYFDKTLQLLKELREHELPAITKAAEICAGSIGEGGLVFLFGNGHSRMMCEEMTPRQGCFPGFVALVEQSLSNHAAIVGANGLRAPLYLERYEGYAARRLHCHFNQRHPARGGRDGRGRAEARTAGDRHRLAQPLGKFETRAFVR